MDDALAATDRRHLDHTAQRRLIDALRSQGERILERAGDWVTMTRYGRSDWYFIGPRGQLRIGFRRDTAIAAPWIADKLLGPSREQAGMQLIAGF